MLIYAFDGEKQLERVFKLPFAFNKIHNDPSRVKSNFQNAEV